MMYVHLNIYKILIINATKNVSKNTIRPLLIYFFYFCLIYGYFFWKNIKNLKLSKR